MEFGSERGQVQTDKTSPDAQIIGYLGEKQTILSIDDRWENWAVLSNLLAPLGFTVVEAVNGAEGLTKAKEVKPNLVITDILMPVTEGSLLENYPIQTQQLFQLSDIQMPLCIDDFGTGFSSLSRLHEFPIATLKIDRSFIQHITTSKKHYSTVQMILALAQALEIDVVAEGIETAEQLEILKELGCDCGQGHFFAKPLDAKAASAYLQDFYQSK